MRPETMLTKEKAQTSLLKSGCLYLPKLMTRNQFELVSELDSLVLRKYGRRSSHFRPPTNRHIVEWRLSTCAQCISQLASYT